MYKYTYIYTYICLCIQTVSTWGRGGVDLRSARAGHPQICTAIIKYLYNRSISALVWRRRTVTGSSRVGRSWVNPKANPPGSLASGMLDHLFLRIPVKAKMCRAAHTGGGATQREDRQWYVSIRDKVQKAFNRWCVGARLRGMRAAPSGGVRLLGPGGGGHTSGLLSFVIVCSVAHNFFFLWWTMTMMGALLLIVVCDVARNGCMCYFSAMSKTLMAWTVLVLWLRPWRPYTRQQRQQTRNTNKRTGVRVAVIF